jgi:hypothetical protein
MYFRQRELGHCTAKTMANLEPDRPGRPVCETAINGAEALIGTSIRSVLPPGSLPHSTRQAVAVWKCLPDTEGRRGEPRHYRGLVVYGS